MKKKLDFSKIYCPICKHTLFVTHKDHYEDLSDHVCNPNEQPSLKDGYQCINDDCLCHQFKCTWLESGEMFIDTLNLPTNITWSKAHELVKELSGVNSCAAYNSFEYYYKLGEITINKYSFLINLYFLKINFIPKPLGYKYEMDKTYMPNLLNWKVEYWLFQKGGGYRHLIPFTTMFMFSINQFNDKVSRLKGMENPLINKNEIKDCVKYINYLSPWGQKEERLHGKIASWWINTFYKNKVKYIIDLNEQLNNK
jgi:hypothetical protein